MLNIASIYCRFAANAFLALGALAAATSPGMARDRHAGQAAVAVAPDLEREWLLQVSPGSGVVAGYRNPLRSQPPASRRWPGYSDMPASRDYVLGEVRRARTPAPGRARIVETASAAAPARAGDNGRWGTDAPWGRKAKQRGGFDPVFLPQEVAYSGGERPGTVVIDTNQKFLYLVGANGTARRYGVGVGKPGFEWAGRHQVSRKSEWPTWTPPSEMRARERLKGRILPVQMAGGPENPLGARAMYLGSSLYRIHGTNQPWSIGKAVSSGCIRMRNEDVMDLYERVSVGTSVIVL